MNAAIAIRPAAPADAPSLARIHVETWRHAYRGIVPGAHLDSLSIEQRTDRWTQILQRPVESTLVAERAGEILGWVSYGACREESEASQAELFGIYLDSLHLRAGIGRALLLAAENRLATLQPEATRITLWVFEQNHPARRFYEALGYRPDGRAKTEIIGGAPLVEMRYAKPT